MTRRTFTAVAVVFLALAGRAAAETKLTVKAEATPPPSDLSGPIRALLEDKALSVYDEKNELLCTVWPRKALESKATADQVRDFAVFLRSLDRALLQMVSTLPGATASTGGGATTQPKPEDAPKTGGDVLIESIKNQGDETKGSAPAPSGTRPAEAPKSGGDVLRDTVENDQAPPR